MSCRCRMQQSVKNNVLHMIQYNCMNISCHSNQLTVAYNAQRTRNGRTCMPESPQLLRHQLANYYETNSFSTALQCATSRGKQHSAQKVRAQPHRAVSKGTPKTPLRHLNYNGSACIQRHHKQQQHKRTNIHMHAYTAAKQTRTPTHLQWSACWSVPPGRQQSLAQRCSHRCPVCMCMCT
jgi:hypothetical protein